MSIATDAQSDLEAICLALAEARPIDSEVSRRVEERSANAMQAIARNGMMDVAVDLVREAREE